MLLEIFQFKDISFASLEYNGIFVHVFVSLFLCNLIGFSFFLKTLRIPMCTLLPRYKVPNEVTNLVSITTRTPHVWSDTKHKKY